MSNSPLDPGRCAPLKPARLMLRSSALAAAAMCAAMAVPAFAQSTPAAAGASSGAAEAVVITANRRPLSAARVLADVTVLEREAIERSGATCAADVLMQVPGIELGRSGGPGGTTSLFLRGAESRHTAVYIDGLRVDSQSTGGAAWEMIPIDQIERIEVLRGPAAAVYGSDAVAGVIQLFTRRGQGALQASASLTAASHDTAMARAALSGVAGGLDYALTLSHGRSEGFNARTTATANPDRDGWQRSGAQARLGLALTPGQRLDAALLASNLRGQYDSSRTADDVSRHSLRTAGLTWQSRWSAEAETRVQVGQTEANYETQPSYYRTETTLRNILLQHDQRFGAHQLGLIVERREDKLVNPALNPAATLRGERHQDALALSWRLDDGAFSWQANLRHDRDSEFGGQSTGGLAAGWRFAPGWRAIAAAGTSFRAPTLYQSYSEYGPRAPAAALKPEEGRNVELGLHWAEGGREFSATTFRNQVRNLINFGSVGSCASSFGCYENVGRVRYEGVSLAGRLPLGPLALRASLDWQDPRNLDADRRLARRARVHGTAGADWAWAGWQFGAEWLASGNRLDMNTSTSAVNGGYGLLNLRAERALGQGLTLDARIDNVADKAYETARTYATGGRSLMLGLRWALR